MKLRLLSIAILISCFFLNGCTSLMVAGAATGAVASQDRRTLPTQLEDQNIELKTTTALFKNDQVWKDCNIEAISYNTNLLLVGQAPTASLKTKAELEAKKIEKVNRINNQIRIGAPISFFAKRNDEYLTSKVKSSMLFTKDFPSAKVKVVTENSEVFLLGLVTKDEAEKAIDIARKVDGVTKVINVLEIIKVDNTD